MRKTRVLFVDGSLGFGGAVRSLSLTLRGLPSIEKRIITSQDPHVVDKWFSGIEVFSFRRVVNYRTKDRIAAQLDSRILRWIFLKGMAVADVFVATKNCIWLIAFLRREQIDLVHLNNGFLPLEALRATQVMGLPCIVHLRDFARAADRPRLALSASRRVSRVITVSRAVGDSLEGSAIPRSLAVTIYDPVDVALLQHRDGKRAHVRNECGLGADDIAIGIFGRVIPWKGQLEFVTAMIPAIAAEPRIRAVIIGDEADGDTRYIASVRDRIRASGVEAHFILTGYRENVEDYYSAMDIVVHASVTPEPFGMVVPEAMAAGCAVIASDEGGPTEVIEHGKDGFLVPPRNTVALTAAVLTLARDPDLRTRMGAAGRVKAAARFSMGANSAEIENLYASVLAG